MRRYSFEENWSLVLFVSDILFAESAQNILPVLRQDDFWSVRTLLTEKKLYFWKKKLAQHLQ